MDKKHIDLVIAAGDLYTDIDVLACAVGYHELLSLMGITSRIVLPGPFNKSITNEIVRWSPPFDQKPGNITNSHFVIVDISEPLHIAKFVNQEKIVRLYDHHYGFENYWHEKYGDRAIIARVGACATLIWEEFISSKLDCKISKLSANLLTTAIISNTLNIKASVTSERDLLAYNQLKKYTNLPPNWVEVYFRDQEVFALNNPYKAVKEDTINVSIKRPFSITIGQLELWDSHEFINKHINEACSAIESFGNPHWFLTSPSISEGKNYIYCQDKKLQLFLEKLLNLKFINNLAITDRLILRKEIKKLLLNQPEN